LRGFTTAADTHPLRRMRRCIIEEHLRKWRQSAWKIDRITSAGTLPNKISPRPNQVGGADGRKISLGAGREVLAATAKRYQGDLKRGGSWTSCVR
jgi:hypothetical protein